MRLKRPPIVITLVSTLCLLVLEPFAAGPVGAADRPSDDAVKPVEVVRTNDYTEGVVVDHDGNLYFSHEKIVTKVAPDGKASTWAKTGSPNGHKILADGTHLICDAQPARSPPPRGRRDGAEAGSDRV